MRAKLLMIEEMRGQTVSCLNQSPNSLALGLPMIACRPS
jgi:hypothetical protein